MIEPLKEFFARSDGVLAAWLFGSRAEGREHAASDVDVAVWLDHAAFPDAAARFEARVGLGSELIGALGLDRVDVVVLNDAPPGLARAATGGVRVYAATERQARDIERDAQLRAADVEPFLRRMARLKLEAVRR